MRRRWLIIAGVGVAVAAGAAFYLAREVIPLARIATAYGAMQTCSCLFVSERSFDSCQTDFNPDDTRWLSWRVEERAVAVSLVGVISSRARFDEGFGCHVAQ
jgi:hypothetical protein